MAWHLAVKHTFYLTHLQTLHFSSHISIRKDCRVTTDRCEKSLKCSQFRHGLIYRSRMCIQKYLSIDLCIRPETKYLLLQFVSNYVSFVFFIMNFKIHSNMWTIMEQMSTFSTSSNLPSSSNGNASVCATMCFSAWEGTPP